MNVHDLILLTKDNPDLLTIEATVTTGFEFLAHDECREKCKPSSIAKSKGRIFFNIPAADFNKVLTLRSVDNVFLVNETIKKISFEENKENDLNLVKSFVEVVNWEKSLDKWLSISEFKGIVYPTKNELVKPIETVCGDSANANKTPKTGISESVSESGSENITTDYTSNDKTSKNENRSSVDTDLIVESEKETCFSKNQNDSVIFGSTSETNLNSDSLNLNDSSTTENCSVHKMVCDLVSKIDIYKVENNDSSNHKLKPEDQCNSKDVVHNSENTGSVSPESNIVVKSSEAIPFKGDNSLACGDVELNNVDLNAIQDSSQGNEGSEKCSTTLADVKNSRKKYEKKPRRGRNMESGQNNNGRPRGRRLPRGNSSKQNQSEENSGILKFRATCYRVGGKHSFNSMEAACEFGGRLQDKFGWVVDLTRFDLNVILNIEKDQAYICFALTNESLHRRNITHFSNTTLRSTMCYSLLRLAEPMTGEIVIDPLCGGGSIPIEGALSFPNTYHICGDYNEKAVERTRANIQHNCKTKTELKVDAVRWNIKFLPIREQSVDVLVSDLPFGRRSGSKQDNQRLYSRVLFELAKVVRMGTGRACLLTYDRTAFTRALRLQTAYWREIRQFGVNQGGLFSTVYLLLRRATPVVENTDEIEKVQLKNNKDVTTTDNSDTTKSKALQDDTESVEVMD